MNTPSTSRTQTEMPLADLQAALNSTMVEARYQPIIRMSDRCPVGLESLARLNHPVSGTLQPDQFVPQLEDAGLAGQLTELVSARAFADMRSPSLRGSDMRMSVNFPLDVLLRPAALERLERQRLAADVPASHIIIELTESRPATDIPELRRSLDWLRALGYGAAIDDVGPAVPCLAPLLDLPFTSLKLDKDLVLRVLECAKTEAFVAATIDQAHQHGLSVVAEGVESEEIWTRLLSLGADEAQGFLAARPLPLAAVPIWLQAWTTTPA